MDTFAPMRADCRVLARNAVLAHRRGNDLAGVRLLRYMLRRCPRRVSAVPDTDACTDAGMLACLETVSAGLARNAVLAHRRGNDLAGVRLRPQR